MIKDRNIIFFGEDWGRFPSTTQHIAKEFLRFNKIMWIGSLAHRRPTLSYRDIKRVIEKIISIFQSSSKPSSINSYPIIINPLIIPLHDLKLFRKINNYLLLKRIKHAIIENNFFDPIIITSSPLIGSVLGKLQETSSHYLCLDDYSHFAGAFKSIINLEKDLLSKISSSFSVSSLLVDTRVPKSGHSYFLPQGVQIDHFVKDEAKIPAFLKNIKKPVIGFFGLVSEWIDIELIVYTAKKLPNYTFLILGKPSIDTSIFKRSKNIVFLGEIPFSKLPNYASIFDVGIIPFKVNELTLACNPLKLLEYLALGLPVVSVDLPEVRKFEESVLISSDKDDFVIKIQNAVERKTSRNYREIAEAFSWQSIAEYVSTKILYIENSSTK